MKTIKDPLKKWGMFSNEEILEYLGGAKHVRIIYLFRVLYKYKRKSLFQFWKNIKLLMVY